MKIQTLGGKTLLIMLLLLVTMINQAFGKEMKRIILIKTMPVPVVLQQCEWFLTQLEELGYKNGINLDLIVFDAKGDRARAESFLRSAVAESKPDLVATSATLASQTAVKVLKGKNIPIVFFTVSDPVGAGLIKKVGEATGGMVTGKVQIINRETRINTVMRLVEQTTARRPIRFGFIHSSYPSSMGDLRELMIIARERDDVEFISRRVEYKKVPEGLPAMLSEVKKNVEDLKDKVDFWWEPSGPLGEVESYSQLLLQDSTVPIAMGNKLKSVELGALLHLTPSIEFSGREAALLADAILNGADSGTIPVTPPTSFDLGINLTTALKMGVVVPPDLLNLAGKNVYR
ncbi:hypothetical protein KJ966_30040 [bacterium]|nr:hypothetical protein [bacterium]